MKVLVLATSPETRGGISSVVLAHQRGEQWSRCGCVWIKTHIDKSFLHKILYFICAIVRFLFLLPFADIVHAHLSSPPSMLRKSLFLFCARLFKKKTIIHFHAFSVESTIKGKYAKKYIRLFEKSDRVIVLSEYWRKEVSSLSPCINVEVLFNPCQSRTKKEDKDKEKWVLYAGALCCRKGYSDLISAFKITEISDWKLVLLGDGETKEARALAQKLGISDQVILPGWVNGEQKEYYFNKASVFCLPSYAEGFPMAVLDAISYGLPIVTTPVGGIAEIAKDQENMMIFSSGDIDGLSKILVELMINEYLRESLSKASKALAESTFSENDINKQLARIYESV